MSTTLAECNEILRAADLPTLERGATAEEIAAALADAAQLTDTATA